jgi:hypothetical protein
MNRDKSDFPTSQGPLLSVVIPSSNRTEFETSLRANRDILVAEGRELVVVHAGDDGASLKQTLSSVDLCRTLLVDLEGARFNKSLCLNIGVLHATSERLFLLDCDVVITEELIREALNTLTPDTFVLVDKVIETDPAAHLQTIYNRAAGIDNRESRWLEGRRTVSTLRFANGKSASYDFWQGVEGRSASGLIFLHKQHYVAIEGSNSETDGWGFEDYDLQIRLQVNLDLERRSVGKATHLTHPAAEDRLAAGERNLNRCFSKYRIGNFLGTYSHDSAFWESRIKKYIVSSKRLEEVEGAGSGLL